MKSNSVISTIVLLTVVGTGFAAVGIGHATVHDSHPNQCYNEKSDSYYSPGESWQLQGCAQATCTKYSQTSSQLMVSFESCGVSEVQPPCYLVQDLSKPYPDCCHQVVCPESDNEEFDGSSSSSGESSQDMHISGSNTTTTTSSDSSSKVSDNDISGSAVHFALGHDDEDTTLDHPRVEHNELNSLEEEDDGRQEDKVESVENASFEQFAQARRIPHRFQFRSMFDIDNGHEQRLNDVDSWEDYQLV